eukprot:s4567_g6.t1
MLQDAAPADRWTAKLLAYPCFDNGFRQAVLSTRLANLQFVLSVEADTPGQFADQVFQWTANSAKDAHELLSSRAPMLEQFWLFVRAAEAVFTDSLGYQMGFARCSKIPRERSASSIAHSIAERAGVHGDPDRSVSSDGILSAEEKAHRSGIDFYPITDDKIPSIDTAAIKALEKDIFTKRGKPLKEATPFDIELVGAMEGFVVQATYPTPARIFMWWDLCLIFASLRFDDTIHVKSHELEFPLVKRDFWILEMESKTSWRSSPPEYARSLQWLHHLVWLAGKDTGVSQAALDKVTHLTWHSARVTMLDQAVHFDRSAQEIGVQANWKNPEPLVLKHTRSRSSLPAKMIKELVHEISRELHPDCAKEDDEIDDQEDRDVTLTEFFVKAPDKGSFPAKMVDRTVYPDKDKVPELALRQIFGRQKLPESLCLLMADKGMLLVERMAMLGDSIVSVKATLKAIVGDNTKFGTDAPAQELSLTLLCEDHAGFREIFVTQHPDMILTYMREPHRKFVERIHRDFLVHGAVTFYEVAEMRTRADRIVQTSGFSKTSDDLLRVVQSDNKVAIASDSDVMDQLHAFFIALEYLIIPQYLRLHDRCGPAQVPLGTGRMEA